MHASGGLAWKGAGKTVMGNVLVRTDPEKRPTNVINPGLTNCFYTGYRLIDGFQMQSGSGEVVTGKASFVTFEGKLAEIFRLCGDVDINVRPLNSAGSSNRQLKAGRTCRG
jgi:hypothetical protein